MRNVVIVGTGGCASEVTFYIKDNNARLGKDQQINILGYLDYEDHLKKHYDNYKFDKPVLGDIDSYIPKDNEEVLLAVANIKFREKVINIMNNKNAKIGRFIHHSSIIPENADLGIGIIVYPFCVIEDYATIGNYNILTTYSFISHDCKVGNNNFFSTSGLAGNVIVGDNNYFGIRSTVIPSVEIGNNNIIQAGMTIDKNINDDTTVFYRYKEKVLAIPKK